MTRSMVGVAAIVVFTSAPTMGTNVWLFEPGASSPLGEIPIIGTYAGNRLRIGDDLWLWVWGRPDEGKTLLNWNLEANVTNSRVLELVDIHVQIPQPNGSILAGRRQFVAACCERETGNPMESSRRIPVCEMPNGFARSDVP